MSEPVFRIDADDALRVADAFARAPEIVQGEMQRCMLGLIEDLTAEVVERTPATYGTLRDSINASSGVRPIPGGVLGVVGSPLDYAPAVELGTRPHAVSVKGIEALADWAHKKFGAPEKEAESIAHAVAWNIRHHGTPAFGMFHRAFAANKTEIARQFEAAVRTIVNRIGS